MNLHQRCQAVFKAGYDFGTTSFRALAAATQLSKSSVHRLYQRIQRRNQYPESPLWETEAGQQWLRLLVFAALFVFTLEGGIGCERLSEFFHLLRLQRHIAVSPSALRTLRAQMSAKILEYQQQQQAQLVNETVEICAAADEKFFDQVVLVLLDLPSGYILLEELTENRQYHTWQQQVQRTKTPTLKRAYQVAAEQAVSALMRHPLTATKSSEDLQRWLNWASWMVSKYQRCSSSVEGRNGYLSQIFHNRRGLSSQQLKVMTVIHNFYLKRGDGTTAAERLFGRQFPDLFQWVETGDG
jgi:hypothetical protein